MTTKNDDTIAHLRAAIVHLEAALLAAGGDLADVPVPEDVDAVVAADPKFVEAKTTFAKTIAQLLADAPSDEVRLAVPTVEESSNAAIAAATDAAWRSGRYGRPGAILT